MMIEVRQRKNASQLSRPLQQQEQQGGGIGAARAGDCDPVTGDNHLESPNGFENAVRQRA
jgi:hypothetical protein